MCEHQDEGAPRVATAGYGDGSDRSMVEMAARVADATSPWTGSVVQPPPSGRRCFSQGEVARTKTFLAPMVVTPIDKCDQCVLIW